MKRKDFYFQEIFLQKSVLKPHQLPVSSLPEIAFLGRSNVGKSSLINALLRKKKIARVSSTPGFTQAINFFRVDHRFMLVDLPGYGFAKAPKNIRILWADLIESYLKAPRPLKVLVLIFDIRRSPNHLDFSLIKFVQDLSKKCVIVLNKIDRLPKTRLPAQKEIWTQAFSPSFDIFLTSCKTGQGINKLRFFLLKNLDT